MALRIDAPQWFMNTDGHAERGYTRKNRNRRSVKPGGSARSTQGGADKSTLSGEIDPEAQRVAKEAALAAERQKTVTGLEKQGFSTDEAMRLIDVSTRLEHSAEAQETRRLRFTRWLVEQGILNEFGA